jgi:hypothetical protein
MLPAALELCGWPSAGPPFELNARQLRQRDVVMVTKVYGRLEPAPEKRDRWERQSGGARH